MIRRAITVLFVTFLEGAAESTPTLKEARAELYAALDRGYRLLPWAIFLASVCNSHAADAGTSSAADVLRRVSDTYLHLSSIHIVARREQTVSRHGQLGSLTTDFDLAAQGRQHYYLHVKQNQDEAIAVSDGDITWKAFVSRKQWTRLQAGTTASGEDAPDSGEHAPADLYGVLAATAFMQYPPLAKLAEEARIAHEADLKVGRAKIACYVVRFRAAKSEYELWIDKQRFLVLDHHQKMDSGGALIEMRIRTLSAEINQPIVESQFRFQPLKAWKEVDGLTLPGEERMTLTGSTASDFTLKTLEGEPVTLDQMRGKVVVLDFWATWCGPCRQELPLIEKLRAEFGDAVQVYGISDEDSGTVRDFVKKNRYEMTVLMDGKREIHKRYRVYAIPTLLVVDKQGVIREHFVGSRDEATLRKAIRSAIQSN